MNKACLFLVTAMFASTLGCQDQNLGDVRPPDAGVLMCAAVGGTCGAASACAAGVGHVAAATSDCTGTATATVCCVPENACPTETFLCCGAPAMVRPLCNPATAGSPATLVCAAGLTPC